MHESYYIPYFYEINGTLMDENMYQAYLEDLIEEEEIMMHGHPILSKEDKLRIIGILIEALGKTVSG